MVRRWHLVALVVLSLSQFPGTDAARVHVLQDIEGDLSLGATGPPPTAEGPWASADLLGLEVEESTDRFLFRLYTGTWQDATPETFTEYTLGFRWGILAYSIEVTGWSPILGGEPDFEADLYVQDAPGQRGDWIARLDIEGSGSDGVVAVVVERTWLQDEDGVRPFSGGRLTDLQVASKSSMLLGFSIDGLGVLVASDRMPDLGTGAYDVDLGVAQQGSLRLATDEPVRASNGEATTYVWKVNVTNDDPDFPDDVSLSLAGVPPTWTVRLPLDRITVAANSSVSVPVLATTPFNHQHGKTERFLLEARSIHDAGDVGRIELGVEYLSIPQPAGHHDTAYLHSRGVPTALPATQGILRTTGTTSASFNSWEDDPLDSDQAVLGTWRYEVTGGPVRAGWVIPLEPALRLGLDFRLGETGTLDVPIGSPLPLTDARIVGHVVLTRPEGAEADPHDFDDLAGVRVLADIDPTSGRSLGRDEVATFSTTITPRAKGDHVEHDPESQLFMILWLHWTGTQPILGAGDTPWLAPGGQVRLPLDEYHDTVDAAYAAPEFLAVQLNESTERLLAPGTSLLYHLRVHNGGQRDLHLELTASGKNEDWLSFPAGRTHTVAANSTAFLPVALNAPATASLGTAADVLLEATDRDDDRIRGLVRFVATVTDAARAEGSSVEVDQSAAIQEIEDASKDSPLGLTLGLVAVAAAVVVARRPGGRRRN